MALIMICDVCKTQDNVRRASYVTHRQPDAAGGTETVSGSFDLCPKCESLCLTLAIKEFFDRIRRMDIHEQPVRWAIGNFNKILIDIIQRRINGK